MPTLHTATPTSVIASIETWRFYYYAGSARIAVREKTSSSNQLFYLLTDHLGGTSKTVNTSGQVVAELRYTAFGETWYTNGRTPTDLKYTGQRNFGELDLYFYQSRFFDPKIAQFTQPDLLIPDPGNPIDFNRFAYVRYNPIIFTDPTGHKACDGENLEGACDTLPAPQPDQVDQSELTKAGNGNYGGQDAYNLYLRLFRHKSGWWWNSGHFTLLDFFTLIFYREGDYVLGRDGNLEQNGYTLIDAYGQGAARAYYGWCLGEGGGLCGAPGTKESFLNWSVRYSGSITGILTAITSGNAGSDLDTQFHQVYTDRTATAAYSPENAAKVAFAFFNPDPSWKVKANQSAGKPYGWANDLKGKWLTGNGNNPLKVVWRSDNFYIPTFEGWLETK